MNKALKIKALPVLFAWCVIFAHSIIPHYHIEEHRAGCCEIVHRISVDIKSTAGFQSESSHDEKTVCHFSSLVFHNLQTDSLFYNGNNRDNSLILPDTPKTVFSEKTIPLFSDNGRGTHSLRAPPLS